MSEPAEAEQWFVPAFLTEGPSLFVDDDLKYLVSFRGKLQPPPATP